MAPEARRSSSFAVQPMMTLKSWLSQVGRKRKFAEMDSDQLTVANEQRQTLSMEGRQRLAGLRERKSQLEKEEKDVAEQTRKVEDGLSRIGQDASCANATLLQKLKDAEAQLRTSDNEVRNLEARLKMTEEQVCNGAGLISVCAGKDGVANRFAPKQIVALYRRFLDSLKRPLPVKNLKPLQGFPPDRRSRLAPDYEHSLILTLTRRKAASLEEAMAIAGRCRPDVVVRAYILTCIQNLLFDIGPYLNNVDESPILAHYRKQLVCQADNQLDGQTNVRNLDLAAYYAHFQSDAGQQEAQTRRKDLVESVVKAIWPIYSNKCNTQNQLRDFRWRLQSNEIYQELEAIVEAAWDFYEAKLLSPDWYGWMTVPPGTPFDPESMDAENEFGGPEDEASKGRTVKLCRAPGLYWVRSVDRFTDQQRMEWGPALVRDNYFVSGERKPPSGKGGQPYCKAIVILETDIEDGRDSAPTPSQAQVQQDTRKITNDEVAIKEEKNDDAGGEEMHSTIVSDNFGAATDSSTTLSHGDADNSFRIGFVAEGEKKHKGGEASVIAATSPRAQAHQDAGDTRNDKAATERKGKYKNGG